MNIRITLLLAVIFAFDANAGSRIVTTGGVTQIEGSAGGGLVPWALIAGYGTRDEIGGTAYFTHLDIDDFSLNAGGIAVGFYDRFEVSLARQGFDLGKTVPGETIRQQVLGFKLRLYGDAVFAQDTWAPQIAFGVQYKRNEDFDLVPALLGAKDDEGVDFYFAATKLYLAAIGGRNLLLNGAVRATRANQLGLLGFGGDRNNSYEAQLEGTIGIFPHDRVLLGVEYRSKPNNLSAFDEDDFKDVYLAWLPTKNIAATIAYASLGRIADKKNQDAWYFSLQASF